MKPATYIAEWTEYLSLPRVVVVAGILGATTAIGWALAEERWFILAAVGAMAVVPVVARWPVVTGVGLYAFLVPFDSVATILGPGSATVTRAIGILATAGLIAAALIDRRRVTVPPLAALWWGLMMLWGALTVLWALDPQQVIYRLPTALSLFVMYAVAASFRPTRAELFAVCALAALGGTLAAVAGSIYGISDAEHARGALVIGDQASNPNDLGAGLILPLALMIGVFLGARRVAVRYLSIGLIGVLGYGIYLSMSRGAVVGIVAAIATFVYRVKPRARTLAVIAILLVVACAVPDEFFRRIGMVFNGEDSTGARRTDIWSAGLDAFGQYGVIGAGLENFPTVFFRHYRRWTAAHNMYLMVSVELGIIGLAFTLAAIGHQIVAAHRTTGAMTGAGDLKVALVACQAACLGILAFAMFGDVIWRKYFWLAWMLLAWAISCARHERMGLRSIGGLQAERAHAAVARR